MGHQLNQAHRQSSFPVRKEGWDTVGEGIMVSKFTTEKIKDLIVY